MHYRQLGNHHATVSEISLGCNRLGEAHSPDSHWIDLVHYAVEQGVTLFDTAESYGWGRSEEILGQAIGSRSDILIASKVSRVQESNAKDFSAARIVAQAEASLRRLQRETIDIYQLHSPTLADLQQFDWPAAMAQLKAQGKIRFAGVSINDVASGEWLIEHGLADVLQIEYSMVQPEVGEALLPLAAEAGVGILVRMPMARGILTGKFQPGQAVSKDHRASLLDDKIEEYVDQAAAFARVMPDDGWSLGQFALRYAITPPAVSAAIPGARNQEQLRQNVAASDGQGLSEEEQAGVAIVQARWQRKK